MYTEDEKDRAQLSRASRGKRGGKGRYKCTLPQDHMTQAQLNKMNGPVKTFNLKEPMLWSDFKAMPDDLKKEYLERLIRDYRASTTSMAEMLGIDRGYVYRIGHRLGVKFHGASSKTPEWRAFVGEPELPKCEKPKRPRAPKRVEVKPEPESEPCDDNAHGCMSFFVNSPCWSSDAQILRFAHRVLDRIGTDKVTSVKLDMEVKW